MRGTEAVSLTVRLSYAVLLLSTLVCCMICYQAPVDTSGRVVVAWYYPWYSTPVDYSVSTPSLSIRDDTADRHWHDCIGVDAGESDLCAAYTPSYGVYDSCDPEVIQHHLEDAYAAGVDVLGISYWGLAQHDMDEVQDVVNVSVSMRQQGMDTPQLAFLYETGKLDASLPVSTLVSTVESDFRDIEGMITQANVVLGDTAPLFYTPMVQSSTDTRIGTVFPYTPFVIPRTVWEGVVAGDAASSLYLSADRPHKCCEDREDQVSYTALFDGVYDYDAYSMMVNGDTYMEDTETMFSVASDAGCIMMAAPVTPGFNDTVVRDGHAPAAREEGVLYKETWQHAVDSSPTMVTVTSWNEWHEATQIERASPALGFQSYSDGPTMYEDLTQTYSTEWRQSKYWSLSTPGPEYHDTPLLIMVTVLSAVGIGGCSSAALINLKRLEKLHDSGTGVVSPRQAVIALIVCGCMCIVQLVAVAILNDAYPVYAVYCVFMGIVPALALSIWLWCYRGGRVEKEHLLS
ncbi:glycosyl hydrolase family 99 [Kipferlia bialata]|uniref:Glycosyl hydrolase family 99 n=1 Tax=Kipferlia bialata TaxID=797122 RepID=A0A9K3GEZ1_9EUKA|nr:glycosyl hydrolase family 99 [Kipferlia bialata]|eukprot:g1118.t1